jgi:hypothetical protein
MQRSRFGGRMLVFDHSHVSMLQQCQCSLIERSQLLRCLAILCLEQNLVQAIGRFHRAATCPFHFPRTIGILIMMIIIIFVAFRSRHSCLLFTRIATHISGYRKQAGGQEGFSNDASGTEFVVVLECEINENAGNENMFIWGWLCMCLFQ